jgi:hypothetical protein
MAKVQLNLGKSKAAVAEGIANLKTAMKEPLPLSLQRRFMKTIAHMEFIHHMMKKVICSQPQMDIEWSSRTRRVVRNRKRRRTR